jgi:hypothetical protein
MNNYTDAERKIDFDYFTKNYQELFKKYGHKFLAIKDKEVLGAYDSVSETIEKLSQTHSVGTYIIQECTGDDSAYRTTIMRLIIGG